jgi:hypothetical protein
MVDPLFPWTFTKKMLYGREEICLEQRMRVRTHIGHQLTLENIRSVIGEEKMFPGIARHIHVKTVIYIERLPQEWKRRADDNQHKYREISVREAGCTTGCRTRDSVALRRSSHSG